MAETRALARIARVFGRSPFWAAAFAGWLGLLFYLSSRRAPRLRLPDINHLDKLLHVGYFALGGLLLGLSVALAREGRLARSAWCFLFLVVLPLGLAGALDEWHQTFTPGRHGGDPLDWLADFAGALAGALVARRATRAGRSHQARPLAPDAG